MEKIIIVFRNEAVIFLDDLIEILYRNEYFGFVESSEVYVSRIYDFIDENIENFPHKLTPKQLKNIGSNYIFFKINPRTTWFIFFEKQNNIYLITQILNNHCEDVKYL